MVLEDPCFEAKYIEKYQNGRVRVIPNIYEANLTPCHIEQLERLEIKANLVAPIINEEKLLGLLVANQCSQFREWQSHEIRWFSQIAMQIGFALENAKLIAANQKANELNKSIFLPQQEDLKQVVIELSEDSRMIFKAFYANALNILNYLGICRQQNQEILDTSKVIKTTAEQVEKQLQRNYSLLEEEREKIKFLLESIPALEESATDDGMIVQQLNEYCQNVSNLINQFDIRIAKQINNSENSREESTIIETDKVDTSKEQSFSDIVETRPLLTSEITKIYQVVEIMQARNQQISTCLQTLQSNKQKIDRILTANSQLEKLLGNIIQSSSNQTQASKEIEKNVLLSHHIAKKISDKSQFLTDLFAQLIAFARNNTEKIMFWEHLKSFMAYFHKLVTSIIKKN